MTNSLEEGKTKTETDTIISLQFFIKIAPNLCKYLKARRTKPLTAARDQILSPPRIGRNAPQTLESIFTRKRNDRDSTQAVIHKVRRTDSADKGSAVVRKIRRTDSVDKGSTTATSSGTGTAPVTPSFTLAHQVSPNSKTPRGRLQSNRGRASRVDHVARDTGPMMPQQGAFPVSKRGRGQRNVSSRGGRVSSRGGRVGADGNGVPRRLDIPVRYDNQSSIHSVVIGSLPPRLN